MRLIDADKLIEDLKYIASSPFNCDTCDQKGSKTCIQCVTDWALSKAPTIEPVKRGEREINADELLKRLDQYFEDNGLEHKWTGDEIADSMSGTVEDVVRIVKEMLGESDDEDEETGW